MKEQRLGLVEVRCCRTSSSAMRAVQSCRRLQYKDNMQRGVQGDVVWVWGHTLDPY